jgi:hypothetical protein
VAVGWLTGETNSHAPASSEITDDAISTSLI